MKVEIQTRRQHTCEIHVVNGLRHDLARFIDKDIPSCFILIDENVDLIYRDQIEQAFKSLQRVRYLQIPSGESSKSITQFTRLTNELLENGVRRNSMVVAIGGGVLGDLAGYVAASVHRGLRLIHVPTTLLAMVDSSIGGKTGINHHSGKNLIGAFFQSESILMDPEFLHTLPQREWNCGFGEVLKYGCMSDPGIFERIGTVSRWDEIGDLVGLIASCAKIKSDIVMRDELESGERAYLNYGHTFAHALEQVTGYTRFAHGEAVYVGLIAATWLSKEIGADVDVDKLLVYKELFDLDTNALSENIETLISAMYRDKKMTDDTLKLILLDSFGIPKITEFNNHTLLKQAWTFALKHVNCH